MEDITTQILIKIREDIAKIREDITGLRGEMGGLRSEMERRFEALTNDVNGRFAAVDRRLDILSRDTGEIARSLIRLGNAVDDRLGRHDSAIDDLRGQLDRLGRPSIP